MKREEKPKTVELVKSDYQPSKAELEEEFSVSVPGDTVLSRMGFMTKAMMQPVKVRWVDRPKDRKE